MCVGGGVATLCWRRVMRVGVDGGRSGWWWVWRGDVGMDRGCGRDVFEMGVGVVAWLLGVGGEAGLGKGGGLDVLGMDEGDV